MKSSINLGWCDVCLRVRDVTVSRAFYEGLGFRRVEGEDDEGYAVLVGPDVRLGLFEERHMGVDDLSLNFRGGDVMATAAALEAAGYVLEGPAVAGRSGGGSARLRDPDGHLVFLDSLPGETKPV